jgi:manganese efflux pump family protein
MLNLILIAASLAMDCLAVSIAGGATISRPKIGNALKVGISFGLFQALMPLIGWSIGLSFKSFIESADHWVAFTLLLVIGIKMLYEAFRKNPEKEKTDITRTPTLLILSVATSIDALVIGISLSIIGISIFISILLIGLFAFIFSVAGYYLGHKIGRVIGNKVEIIGGLILIGIGTKILAEHMM